MGLGRRYEEKRLLSRSRSSSGSRSSTDVDLELDAMDDAVIQHTPSRYLRRWLRPRRRRTPNSTPPPTHYFRAKRRRSLCSGIYLLLRCFLYTILSFIIIAGVLFPSYTHPPDRYTQTRTRLRRLNWYDKTGAGNLDNEKVFIAASLYDKDGELLAGHWGRSVLGLVDMLGPENVFVSIYENDPDEQSREAMEGFGEALKCKSAIKQEHYNGSDLPHAILPNGAKRVKRLPFLAEVRNRALQPLVDEQSSAYHTRWDKILYLNDVAFNPVDAINLLFNTHADSTGKANYRAACAVDFINPFKFYDTFATRDTEGYDMGVPFYPWFTNAGRATSRKDVLKQADAVRVKSCWGGMVAFDAKWFQPRFYDLVNEGLVPKDRASRAQSSTSSHPAASGYQSLGGEDFSRKFRLHPDTVTSNSTSQSSNTTIHPPLRFRAETDTYWGASECCLIHADLAHAPYPPTTPIPAPTKEDFGIYLNPYVRVAYSRRTLFWLRFTRRFERLYPFIHRIVNLIGRRPGHNPRQFEQPGEEVVDKVWQWDERSLAAIDAGTVGELPDGLNGSWVEVKRIARPGMFCGGRRALYMKEEGDGEGKWGTLEVPPEG